MTMQDGIRAVEQAFIQAATPPRWPMYVRQAKQFLRSAVDGFDERKYGFASVVDLLRAAGKEGVLRLERDRQGAIRVFPGGNMGQKTASKMQEPMLELDETVDVEVPPESIAEPSDMPADAEGRIADDGMAAEPVEAEPASLFDSREDVDAEPVTESPILDGETIEEEPGDNIGNFPGAGGDGRRPARKTTRKTARKVAPAPRATKTAKPRSARPRRKPSRD